MENSLMNRLELNLDLCRSKQQIIHVEKRVLTNTDPLEVKVGSFAITCEPVYYTRNADGTISVQKLDIYIHNEDNQDVNFSFGGNPKFIPVDREQYPDSIFDFYLEIFVRDDPAGPSNVSVDDVEGFVFKPGGRGDVKIFPNENYNKDELMRTPGRLCRIGLI